SVQRAAPLRPAAAPRRPGPFFPPAHALFAPFRLPATVRPGLGAVARLRGADRRRALPAAPLPRAALVRDPQRQGESAAARRPRWGPLECPGVLRGGLRRRGGRTVPDPAGGGPLALVGASLPGAPPPPAPPLRSHWRRC